LEQNARMLAATIQALEVQRMTLATLKTMNVPLAQLRDSLKLGEAAATPAAMPVEPPTPRVPKKRPAHGAREAAPAEAATPAVDPLQWWGALTKQFTQLAATAMKDSSAQGAKNLAGAMVKQGLDAAEQTLKKAATTPGRGDGAVGKAATRAAGKAKRARKRSAQR
jgi:hypothetical protein